VLLKFATRVRSRADWLGTLVGVVIEPNDRILLRVLIEQPRASPLVHVGVPFGHLEAADASQVVLSISPAEFKRLPVVDRDGGVQVRRRSPSARGRRGDEATERLITARSRVTCRDGEVGTVSALQVDARTGDLQAFTFAFGMPLTREVLVGFERVERVENDGLELGIDMDDLAEFPTLRD
jgi:hypothetical protein